MAPSEGGGRPAAARSLWIRARLYGAVGFVVLHATVVLVTGLPKEARRHVWPAMGWYADGLKLTNRWGMFSRPPRDAAVEVVAEARDGSRTLLSTSIHATRTPWRRIVDTRLRKIQGSLAKEGNRAQHGRSFLDYFCRRARASNDPVWRLRLEEATPRRFDDGGRVVSESSRKTLLVQRCPASEAAVKR